ncbi:MAG: site-specific integrase [Thermodesulfobacteriota bacterium]|jgi:site-specific recombinase XerD
MKTDANFPRLLQAFFTDRLMNQQQVSPNTIATHRDSFRLLALFAQKRLKKSPSNLSVEELDAPFISEFLDHLEKERGNTPRSRNVRLAAIHSFFRYVALNEPFLSALAQRVLAMPSKRFIRRQVEFLTDTEVEALLDAPDLHTWIGRRDRVLLLIAVQTGLRVSELAGLRHQDVILGNGAHIRCTGKGRKQRCTPLRKDAVAALHSWLREQGGVPSDPLFPNIRGGKLSRDAIEYLVAKHITTARQHCPSLVSKRTSPHVLRHTTAMDLLQHGVDRTVIALWLGHETAGTVDVYLHANLDMKEKALAKTALINMKQGRYRPSDEVLAFLQSL